MSKIEPRVRAIYIVFLCPEGYYYLNDVEIAICISKAIEHTGTWDRNILGEWMLNKVG